MEDIFNGQDGVVADDGDWGVEKFIGLEGLVIVMGWIWEMDWLIETRFWFGGGGVMLSM